MKKITHILLLMFFGSTVMAQVGIGTETPLKDLHVAEPNGTIRIESLNATNNPTFNDGINLAAVFVDGNGDVVLGNGSGSGGNEPLNFLIDVPNFIADDPGGIGFNTGVVVNNNASGEFSVKGQIASVNFTTPFTGWLELKFGVTTYVAGSDIGLGCPCSFPNQNKAIVYQTYFIIDFFSDGLSTVEQNTFYGYNGQYYLSENQGAQGYAYINGQANLKAPAGNHTLYMFGVVKDSPTEFTSVGFGGAEDYLKIRVFN